jgi:nitrite reductase/ring-hydroxylating ferredoxin subunit
MKMYQSTSYALIVDTHTEIFSDGIFINSEVPQISLRTVKDGDKNLLLIVGYDYKTGSEIVGNPFDFLEAKIKRIYPSSEVIRKWTAEDCISLDKVPYIGDFSNIMKNIYVATGFNKWGITTSNIAANIIRDKIIGVENEYEEIFKSSRLEMIKNKDEVMNMVKEAGDGIIIERIKGKQTPTCTHLGCKLSWNAIEKTWDCPCHGSRFDKNGIVIESPASENFE